MFLMQTSPISMSDVESAWIPRQRSDISLLFFCAVNFKSAVEKNDGVVYYVNYAVDYPLK